MATWNVVATIRGKDFRTATRVLGEFGRVKRTRFYNVLVANVRDPEALLEPLQARLGADEQAAGCVARVVPVPRTFEFRSPEAFDAQTTAALRALVPAIAGKSFHVRVHHRGTPGMSSRDEERKLDLLLLDALEQAGLSGRIAFENPDAIVAVEIVGSRAGVSMWPREDLQRYPILHLD